VRACDITLGEHEGTEAPFWVHVKRQVSSRVIHLGAEKVPDTRVWLRVLTKLMRIGVLHLKKKEVADMSHYY
jgi:hypothetical protein